MSRSEDLKDRTMNARSSGEEDIPNRVKQVALTGCQISYGWSGKKFVFQR